MLVYFTNKVTIDGTFKNKLPEEKAKVHAHWNSQEELHASQVGAP
jgi:hypothetical protein